MICVSLPFLLSPHIHQVHIWPKCVGLFHDLTPPICTQVYTHTSMHIYIYTYTHKHTCTQSHLHTYFKTHMPSLPPGNVVLTLWPSWHELPKSTILIALRLGLHKRMFSGLRSQCMMFSSGVARNSSAVHSCWANLRVKLRDTPRKFVFRNKSYKL